VSYANLPGVNFSTLKYMRRSPLHYRHACENAREDSDTFRLGRLTHTLVLEPERVASEYVVWDMDAAERTRASMPANKKPPTLTTARRGKLWDAFEAANAGRTIVTTDQMRDAQAMAAAVLRVWTPPANCEVTLQWLDYATGLACKGRLDAVDGTWVTEIKTTYDAASSAMSRSMGRYDYHCQLAHYRAGAIACGLADESVRARIIAVESSAPYDVAIYEVDDEALMAGEEEVARLLARVRECTDAGVWPGRYTEPQVLSLPGWMRDEGEDDIADLGLVSGSTDDDEETDE
jgi:hypothetical protein